MPYWRLYYHIVWATFRREPFLIPEIERRVHRFIHQRCESEGGIVYAINGMSEHVHLIAALPPARAISEVVRILKGSSSHFARTKLNDAFCWQEGYSVFSISSRNLDQAIEYVNRQKEHHKHATIIPALEYITAQNNAPSPR